MFWINSTQIKGRIKEHRHAMHEFLVCLNGTISVEESRNTHILRQGSAIFIPSNVAHKIKNLGSDVKGSQVSLACVKPVSLELMCSPANSAFITDLTQAAFPTHTDNYSEDPLRVCLQEANAISNIPSQLNHSLQENCFLKMLLLHAERIHRDSMHFSANYDKISDIAEWLNKHYTDDVNLDDLSRQFSISRSQLTRKFKQQYGVSLIELVLQLRLEAAAKNLAVSRNDITCIALNVGFNNLSHFHRQFKKKFGMTPLTFRNMTAQTQ